MDQVVRRSVRFDADEYREIAMGAAACGMSIQRFIAHGMRATLATMCDRDTLLKACLRREDAPEHVKKISPRAYRELTR
jgi:hypothetical protein